MDVAASIVWLKRYDGANIFEGCKWEIWKYGKHNIIVEGVCSPIWSIYPCHAITIAGRPKPYYCVAIIGNC